MNESIFNIKKKEKVDIILDGVLRSLYNHLFSLLVKIIF